MQKALARSVSLAPGAEDGIRDRVRAALEAMGRPPDARAESLAPEEWRELHARLADGDDPRPGEGPPRGGAASC